MNVGLLPCAGKGSRFSGRMGSKEMQPQYGGEPLIVSALERLARLDLEYVVVVIDDGHEDTYQYLRTDLDLRFEHMQFAFIQQKEHCWRHDLPAAILSAQPLISMKHVYLTFPDTVIQPVGCLAALKGRKGLTVGLFPSEESERFGMVDVYNDGERNIISDAADKVSRVEWGDRSKYCWGILTWFQPADITHGFSGELFWKKTVTEAIRDYAKKQNDMPDPNYTVVIFQPGVYRDAATAEDLANICEWQIGRDVE